MITAALEQPSAILWGQCRGNATQRQHCRAGRLSAAQAVMTDLAQEDHQLMGAVARGDHPGLVALHDRYGRIAYGLAYRILGDTGAAEEAVQDAYLRVWRRAATFDASRGGARSWLLTIVHHCAIDLVRRRDGAPSVVAGLDEMADRQSMPDAWSEVSGRIESERVRTAVETLTGQAAPRDRDGVFRWVDAPRYRGV